MTDIAEIKEAIIQLSSDEVAELQSWLEEWLADQWDQQIEEDVRAGALDVLAEEAIRAFRAGDYTER